MPRGSANESAREGDIPALFCDGRGVSQEGQSCQWVANAHKPTSGSLSIYDRITPGVGCINPLHRRLRADMAETKPKIPDEPP